MLSMLAGFAFVIALGMSRWCLEPGSVLHLVDIPNERSLHDRPIPRCGGLAIAAAVFGAGVAAAVLVSGQGYLAGIAIAAVLVGGISYLDDRSHVAPAVRLVVHILVAVVLVYSELGIKSMRLPGLEFEVPALAGAVVSCLFIVWMVNLYNFMDGMDGFAGGMAVIGFGCFALLAAISGDQLFAALALVVSFASAGFLVFNFPPARIFMGDVGSSLLGVSAAAFSLWADREGYFPLWVAVLVFSPFIVDATVTLARRLVRRERVWEAHRSHYYQRLVRLGWGHRRTVLAEYVLMAGCGASALVAVRVPPATQWVLIGAWVVVYLAAMAWVEREDRRPRDAAG